MLIISLFILTASALIVHELGHLAAARRCKVAASELALGLGPRLCGLRLGSIAFNLRILCCGCRLRYHLWLGQSAARFRQPASTL